MASEAVENYIKAIYALQRPGGMDAADAGIRGAAGAGAAGAAFAGAAGPGGQVSIGELATAVGVTPGTATTMVKKLAADRLVRYERYGGVELTVKGERLALSVLRRHRLVETFLVHTLGMDWGEVHDEAERLEHALSDRLLERLDEFLGRPAVDPHGDPIPDRDGRTRAPALVPLPACAPGSGARIHRIADQSHDFLRFVDAHGLRPGAQVRVVAVEPGAGTIALQVAGGSGVTMSLAAAGQLLVQRGVTRGFDAATDRPPRPSSTRPASRRGRR
ncbi:MAG: metal-dependent transcriptional regulator [Phycisphaerales bacterium]